MTITTKFDIGNTAYIFIGNTIKEYVITGIDVYTKTEVSIYYQLKSTTVNNSQTVVERDLFRCKEDAASAWLKAQGITCGLKAHE